VNLFRSLLKRFLEEFEVIELGTDTPDAAALAVHAGRLHKLAGCGGLLGAKAINQLAIAAEAACRSGKHQRAAQLTKEVASLIQQLAHSAAPFLEATRARAEQLPVASNEDADPQLIVELVDLLQQQCLSAVDRFEVCSPQLLRHLGKESYERMRDHVDNCSSARRPECWRRSRGKCRTVFVSIGLPTLLSETQSHLHTARIYASSVASSEMSAFRTLETGQPAFAFAARAWKVA